MGLETKADLVRYVVAHGLLKKRLLSRALVVCYAVAMMSSSTTMGRRTTNAASRSMKGFMLVRCAEQPANRQPGVGKAGENEETCNQHWTGLDWTCRSGIDREGSRYN